MKQMYFRERKTSMISEVRAWVALDSSSTAFLIFLPWLLYFFLYLICLPCGVLLHKTLEQLRSGLVNVQPMLNP